MAAACKGDYNCLLPVMQAGHIILRPTAAAACFLLLAAAAATACFSTCSASKGCNTGLPWQALQHCIINLVVYNCTTIPTITGLMTD